MIEAQKEPAKKKTPIRTPVRYMNPAIRLPARLTEGECFVCWKGKKIPFDPRNNKPAKVNDPETWTDFETCHRAYRLGKYDGVGIVLTSDDDLICIDLDSCLDEKGKPTTEAIGIISKFSTYIEISPSKRGLHVWLEGKKPGSNCRKGIVEIYETGRYVTLTGEPLFKDSAGHKEVNSQQKELEKVYFEIWPEKEEKLAPETKAEPRHCLTDDEIIERAKSAANGEKFKDLWDGDTSESGGDHSAADQALTNMLVFWCGPDEERVDKLFRESGLMRPKWDEKHRGDGATYGAMTIETALATVKEFYSELNPLKALHRNEDGDAELFRNTFKNDLRYDHAEGEWYRWVGQHWARDSLENVMRDLEVVINIYEKEKKRAAKLFAKAFAEGNKGAMKKWKRTLDDLRNRIHALRTHARKKNVLAIARCGTPLGLTGSEWDTHPWLLPCANGVIDLRTGDLSEGSREDYIKSVAPTEWQGLSKEAPRWKQFLQEVFNRHGKLISYTQRLLGMALVGEVTEHVFPIFWGKGRNGKGTMLETISHALGPLAGPIQGEMLLSQKWARSSAAPSADIMALRGRRLAWASETEEGRALNISKVKWLVGGDTLAGRPPFGRRVIEFRPSHTLLLLTNNKPKASADDYALWERISLVPFTQSFVNEPVDKDECKSDPKLLDKLKLEAPGILAWLVQGSLAWRKHGLKPPEFVKMATEEYREEEDILSEFLDDCYKVGMGLIVKGSKFYKAYKWWAEGLGYKPWSNTAFGTRMTKRFKKEKTMKGVFYQGVTLTVED